MVKHTQTNRWQQLRNCLGVFDYSVGLVLKGLRQNQVNPFDATGLFLQPLKTSENQVF